VRHAVDLCGFEAVACCAPRFSLRSCFCPCSPLPCPSLTALSCPFHSEMPCGGSNMFHTVSTIRGKKVKGSRRARRGEAVRKKSAPRGQGGMPRGTSTRRTCAMPRLALLLSLHSPSSRAALVCGSHSTATRVSLLSLLTPRLSLRLVLCSFVLLETEGAKGERGAGRGSDWRTPLRGLHCCRPLSPPQGPLGLHHPLPPSLT